MWRTLLKWKGNCILPQVMESVHSLTHVMSEKVAATLFQNPGNAILSRDLWNVRVLRKWIGLLEIRRNKQGKMLKKIP